MKPTVKCAAIDRGVRAYQDGLDAYAELEQKLRAAQSATAEVPLRIPSVQEARARLAEAYPVLSRIGEALAFLPALALQLREERRVSGNLRRQALQCGVKLRYEPADEEEDDSEARSLPAAVSETR